MRKTTKTWLITAASLVLIGCIIFVGAMSMLKWDFTKLSTVKYETNTYEISEEFSGISVKTNTADIVLVLSDDGKCKVECYEEENANHSTAVKDGILTVELIDQRSLLDYIGINFGSPKITIHLPKTEYTSLLIREHTGDIRVPKDFSFKSVDISLSTGDVEFYASASEKIGIKGDTGDIYIENISAGSLDLSVSTGKVTAVGVNCSGDFAVSVSTGKTYLTDIECKNLISIGNTGIISLKNVIAVETFSIKRSTGDVTLDGCDAAEIYVETDTGEVKGRLLTEKVFITETSTGKVDVPKSVTGGRCEIITSTGGIKISIGQ